MYLQTTPRRLGAAAFVLTAFVAGCGTERAPIPPGGPFPPGGSTAATSTPAATSTTTPTTGPSSAASGAASPTAAASGAASPTAAASGAASPTAAATATAVATASPVASSTPVSGATLPPITSTGNTTCTAPNEPAGTYYASLFVLGNVVGTTLSLDTTQTFANTYTLDTLVAATPLPTASPLPSPLPSISPLPSSSPFPIPTTNPLFVYIGEYSTTSGMYPTTGCFTAATTQNGSPLTTGFTDNTGAEGFINYDTTALTVASSPVPTMGGITALTVSNLSGTGGSGSFTLSDGTTGTITITGRTSIGDYLRRNGANHIRSGRVRLPI